MSALLCMAEEIDCEKAGCLRVVVRLQVKNPKWYLYVRQSAKNKGFVMLGGLGKTPTERFPKAFRLHRRFLLSLPASDCDFLKCILLRDMK